MRTMVGALFVWLAASTALAGEPVVRGGVPLDSLTPEGLQRLSVAAPASGARPVRLVFGTADAPQVLMDVLVAPGADAARAALEDWRRTVVQPPSAEPLGDVGYGAGPLHAFARDNVFVAVHRVAGDADAQAIAAQADAAIQDAPAGRPTASPVPDQQFDDAQLADRPLPIVFPAELVAAAVSVCGPGYARRTTDGWVVVRSGPGLVTVRVVGVDRLLRSTP